MKKKIGWTFTKADWRYKSSKEADLNTRKYSNKTNSTPKLDLARVFIGMKQNNSGKKIYNRMLLMMGTEKTIQLLLARG